MSEGHWYLAAGIIVLAGVATLGLGGPQWPAMLLLAIGLGAGLIAAWLYRRRARSVQLRIEDEHLHPIPVLDAPKGTYDLIAGMTVRFENRRHQPVGVRIETLLYRRTPWGWDRPVSDTRAVPLLVPSVVPGRSDKSFFVKNYTRIPAAIEELTTRHFVKLVVATSDAGKSVHRVFLRERFELPKKSPEPPPRPAVPLVETTPLLPFSDRLEPTNSSPPETSLGGRLAGIARRFGLGGRKRGKIHRLRKTDDSLEGLMDELNAELEEAERARGGGSSSPRGR